MRIRRPNRNISALYSRYIIGFTLIVFVSCNSTKYIPENKTLLDRNSIQFDQKAKSISKSEFKDYIKQKPNKRILGFRFHLGLYNLSNPEKEKWPHKWLRTIGEEPVIFDEFQTGKSSKDIESFLVHKGYFNATVNDTVFTKKKKTRVHFQVRSGIPFKIRKINYQIEDTAIAEIILADTISSVIRTGQKYDVDNLQQERLRIERLIRNYGYYNFSKENISFQADSTVDDFQLDLTLVISKFRIQTASNRILNVPHRKYKINNVFIYPGFDPQSALADPGVYYQDLDTFNYDGFYLMGIDSNFLVKPKRILQSNYIKGGQYYDQTDVEQTRLHLTSLDVYRSININFKEVENAGKQEENYLLDCHIQLIPITLQSYTIELEGTNSAGNLGGAVNLLYKQRNLFRGSEVLDLKLKGAFETLTEKSGTLQNTLEMGAEARINFPKFLFPFLDAERFIKKYNPETFLSFAYNYQKRPVFTRTIANISFGYHWQSSKYSSHIVNPLEINAVKLPVIDPGFAQKLDTTTYLAYSYKDVLITALNYSYIFNNQNIKKISDFIFFRLNMESAGNTLSGFLNVSNRKIENENYSILGLEYAQYLKGDIDFRYHHYTNKTDQLVCRAFLGVGYPYGNSQAMPFEKQYFSGGANGIRAWHVRELGPGSYDPGDISFYNQTADIKIETNLEYRFKLFWVLEGALFLDAGNIWAIRQEDERPGSVFQWDKFYNDIALGTGFGARFDFSFFIFRLDMGMKLRDPSINDSKKWVWTNGGVNFKDDFTLHLGIGYPF